MHFRPPLTFLARADLQPAALIPLFPSR
jgi:hypothetical protein